MTTFRRLTFLLPASGEERLTGELWGLGTLGVELRSEPGRRLRALAWFAGGSAAAESVSGHDWSACGAELVACEEVAERDWLAVYRERARPFKVGERLLVDPGEPGPARDGLLRIPARSAFGTGSHESTRLAVELLERTEVAGRMVLDVGTGSGILAFAALLFGAAAVIALDVDPGAALLAGQNARLNRLRPRLLAGRAGCLGGAAAFDLALVNVLPESVRGDLGDLRRLVRPGGEAIFSGILRRQGGAVRRRLRAAGFRAEGRRRDGEWVAYRARRVRP